MTATYSHPRVDAAFSSSLDKILKGVCQKIELSPTQYNLAVNHYDAVGNWLDGNGSPLAYYNPKVYPQGSLPMGTTNKPLDHLEYDLDAVCEFDIPWYEITNPSNLVQSIAERLKSHGDYKNRLEIKPRCIRLTYAHDFHLDIVPACKHSQLGEGQIRIPNGSNEWKDSNSRMYIQWFNGRANLYKQKGRIDFAEPIPAQQMLEEKSPLQCAVQLIKRSRDVFFRGNSNLAPASIVLNTLCAQAYQGEDSVFETVLICLESITRQIDSNYQRRLVVRNPANNAYEDLGEKWDNKTAYDSFVRWIRTFQASWLQLSSTKGLHSISTILERLFDEEPTKKVIQEYSENLQKQKTGNSLYVAPSGILGLSGTQLRSNTFYGQ